MEMWLFYNDELTASQSGPITTYFVNEDLAVDQLRIWKDVFLAMGDYSEGIPSCTKVEHYRKREEFGDFKFVGLWTAPRTRTEALIAKYGSLDNL